MRFAPRSLSSTYLECPVNLLTGATSFGSSSSLYSVKPWGTCHMNTFPSSEPEAITRSLKGFLTESALYFELLDLHPPVCVQHRPSVSSKERDLLRQATFLVDRYDCKGASTAGFPIDGEVFWICLDSLSAPSPFPKNQARGSHLHQICIPSIATDVQVVIASLLSRRLPKDMSCPAVSVHSCPAGGGM